MSVSFAPSTLNDPAMPQAIANRIAQIQSRFAPSSASVLGGSSASTVLGAGTTDTFGSLLDGLTGSSTTDLTATDPTSTDGSGTSGAAVLADATKYLGVPYKWGGTNPATGLDCSGFVQQVYGDLGVTLPRVSRDQAKTGTAVASIADAKVGDLVAFGQPVDHISIYAGNGMIIEAPHTGDVVKFTPLSKKSPPTAIRRILPDATTAQVGGSSSGLATNRITLAAQLAAAGLTGSSTTGSISSPTAPITSLSQLDARSTGVAGSLPDSVPYKDLFVAAGNKYGLDPRLLAAIGKIESNFRTDAVSGAGAQGLMQFMPGTAKGMGIDPSDPAQSIDAAGRYLRTQLNRFGSVQLAVAAYNAGPAAVQRAGGVPANAETQNYGPKILNVINGGNW